MALGNEMGYESYENENKKSYYAAVRHGACDLALQPAALGLLRGFLTCFSACI